MLKAESEHFFTFSNTNWKAKYYKILSKFFGSGFGHSQAGPCWKLILTFSSHILLQKIKQNIWFPLTWRNTTRERRDILKSFSDPAPIDFNPDPQLCWMLILRFLYTFFYKIKTKYLFSPHLTMVLISDGKPNMLRRYGQKYFFFLF